MGLIKIKHLVWIFALATSSATITKMVNDRNDPQCDPRKLIVSNEGRMPCMYMNSHGKRAIGVGFKLDGPGAREVFSDMGLDYDSIISGSATPKGNTCNCQSVKCLTDGQIGILFTASLYQAANTVFMSVSGIAQMCCTVQNAVTDMAYDLGPKEFQTSLKYFIYFLGQFNFQAAADDQSVTAYCTDAITKDRCMRNEKNIRSGCNCSKTSRPQTCPATKACCNSVYTCCTEAYTMREKYQKNVTISWCCPLKGASCCDTFCCPSNFPVCCMDGSGRCCPQGHTCSGGRCYSKTSKTFKDGVKAYEGYFAEP